MDNQIPEIQKSRLLPIDINSEMQKSYIAYSMAVLTNRALPDVRDGLKPVQRRILFDLAEQGFTPDKPHKKCAAIVGDTMGKYHPHGDSSIYDALVRMAQTFSMRYPLVDGHGNFGSIDGDGAAAMRYTEARMSKMALELLRDLDKDTVDFYPNYDGSLQQPVTLPSRYPNLLVNGTGGIAVGMATNIPPHNLGEVTDAAIALIDDPEMGIDELMDILPGPDFPTGGRIAGVSGIKQAYRTGRGRVRVRAKAEIESRGGDRERIVITEIPFQVNKEALIASINQLVADKRIDGIEKAQDHTDKTGMRIEIALKSGANANVVLNRLYKHTQMQDTFGIIMIALVNGIPRTLNLKQMLEEYIKYQVSVIERRTRFDLEKTQKRAHILEGLLRALDSIDEIIETIRSSSDVNVARSALMEGFGFSEVQAQAILEMRLQRLTGLERDKIQSEYDELMERIDYYQRVLSTPSMVLDIIKKDLLEIKEKYGDQRRTEIQPDESDIDIEELIQREDMVVTLTHFGYIKRVSTDTYKSQRRGGRGITGLSTREEDFVQDMFIANTHSSIMFFTDKGKSYILKCYRLPEASRTAKGTAIVNLLNLAPDEKIAAVFPLREFDDQSNLVMVTKLGLVKKTPLSAFSNIRQNGLIAISIRDNDSLITVIRTTGDSSIILGSRDGMSISIDERDIRTVGRQAQGVIGMKLRNGDEVVDAGKLTEDEYIMLVTENGYGKLTPIDEFRVQGRAGIGVKAIGITEKTGKLAGLKIVDGEEDVMLINDANVLIRMSTSDISHYGRTAQGVRLMKVDDDTKVVCITKLPAEEPTADFDEPVTE